MKEERGDRVREEFPMAEAREAAEERRHPAKAELLTYAEALVDQETTVDAKTAAHVASCPSCREELQAMGATLDCVRDAQALSVSRDATARLLLAARHERRSMEAHRELQRIAIRAVKGLTYAAVLALVVSVGYISTLRFALTGNAVHEPAGRSSQVSASVFSLEALRRPSPEQERLAETVLSSQRPSPGRWEREQLRTVAVLDDDISEALEALANNPFCARAEKLLNSSRERRMETLKTLYVERSF